MVWEVVVVFAVGVIMGCLLCSVISKGESIGNLRVDNSDPDDGPYLFLEMYPEGMNRIHKKRFVTLKVVISDYISRK